MVCVTTDFNILVFRAVFSGNRHDRVVLTLVTGPGGGIGGSVRLVHDQGNQSSWDHRRDRCEVENLLSHGPPSRACRNSSQVGRRLAPGAGLPRNQPSPLLPHAYLRYPSSKISRPFWRIGSENKPITIRTRPPNSWRRQGLSILRSANEGGGAGFNASTLRKP